MVYCSEFPIRANKKVLPGHWLMSIEAPAIAQRAQPGQFVHIRCQQGADPLLRRPLSLHQVDRKKGLIQLLYRVVGRGTTLMAQKKAGDLVDVLGPLGRGFTLPLPGESVVLVGGGIGVAPLVGLAQAICSAGHRLDFIMGASTADQLLPEALLPLPASSLHWATDDGSKGYHGLVTSLLRSLVKGGAGYQRLYGCGPMPMLKTLTVLAEELGIPGEISLEEKMACGMGACLSCVCKIKDAAGQGFTYERVCTQGPVFGLEEVYHEG